MTVRSATGTVTAFNPKTRQLTVDGVVYNVRRSSPLRRHKPGDRVSVTYDDVNAGRDYSRALKSTIVHTSS